MGSVEKLSNDAFRNEEVPMFLLGENYTINHVYSQFNSYTHDTQTLVLTLQ